MTIDCVALIVLWPVTSTQNGCLHLTKYGNVKQTNRAVKQRQRIGIEELKQVNCGHVCVCVCPYLLIPMYLRLASLSGH